jgi:sugar phosphate isomerase/epimerase
MMNRRNFLRGAAVGMTACAGGARWSSPLWANPYGLPVGLQLYTVREQLPKDVPGTLKKVAEIGYKEVEVYDLYGRTAKQFSQLLKDNGLTAPSGHYETKHIKENWQKHIDDAKELGMKYMVNAILDRRERTTFDEYKQLVGLFSKAAEETRKAGIQFCYHNHNFEFAKFAGTTAYDFLLQELDPKLVQFEMDCFWVTHAGQDPVAYFQKYAGRFELLHIKDLKDKPAPTHKMDDRMGLFAEVGRGTIDYQRIFKAAPQGGMKHFYVEQDFCERSPLESIKMSYDYLHQLTV